MEKKISVIIPVYNVEEYLEECVNSVINQTYRNLEIILVDDGSTDQCPAICDEYEKKDSRIKVIHKINGGLADARNAGLKIATGDYIGYVDSDDYIDIEMYEKLYTVCEKNTADVAICKFQIFSDQVQNDLKSEMICKEYSNIEALTAYIDEKTEELITPSAWSKLYRKDCVNGLEFPKGKLCEDIVYTTKAFYNATKVVYVDQELYYYRNRPGSIMNEPKVVKRRIQEEIEQYEDRLNFLQGKRETKLVELCSYELYKRMQIRYCELCKNNKDLQELMDELLCKMQRYKKVSRKISREISKKLSINEIIKINFSLMSPKLYGYISTFQSRR